ncbi:hypothetical protein [Streptomyces sp. ISL-10]|uniref:hypothetical protein n=1 Tax=Streptomyces sp. ISL-10 TaxID=2819172 RepID=UPI0035AC1834
MAALDAWLVFEDEAGFSMTPPTTRTWSRRGHTPVVRVRGRSRRRLSVAALACYKAGESSRLIYRPCPDARPEGAKASDAASASSSTATTSSTAASPAPASERQPP